ncbi:branched-chain amino acid ABC transporter substrate-binding protein [Pollutimonas nitritireducens]|uniref:Branched-chain amino acid ABC transporter substrate-binding protein n=1 Tax=Pollutimonas nitritireducens TaxID=2045209 RepID=A0A2N4UG24_9BURK|nr:ABC transporter substrate-binding protein [Pollutimonas nitritireducens]PLC53960.1 branched-chain amino acid ABC transporter substrate-binding protein [Pollutimonas nitritireducens]
MEDRAKDSRQPQSTGIDHTRRSLTLGAGGAAVALAFPGILRAQPKRIPIGVVVGLTGRAGPWGAPVNNAVRLAVEQINASGGIKSKGGAQIDLISVDHQSNPQMAGTQTERVIQVNNVLAVIGNATSGATMVGSAVSEKAGVPMISTDLGDSLTNRGMKYFFRIGARASHLAATGVDFAEQMVKVTGTVPRKVATMADDSTFSQDAIQGAISRVRQTGWNFQENVSFPAGKVSDFLPILQRLKLSGVDLIFHALFAPDGIQVMRGMKALNYDLMASVHIAGAPYTPEYVENLKADADFVTDVVGFVPELTGKNPLLANYADAYKAKYRRDLDDQASLAVTCVGALYDALERATDLSSGALAEALRTTDLELGSNPYVLRDGIKFDEKGDNIKAKGLVMQLRKGQQRIVYPSEMATIEAVWPMPAWSKRT